MTTVTLYYYAGDPYNRYFTSKLDCEKTARTDLGSKYDYAKHIWCKDFVPLEECYE